MFSGERTSGTPQVVTVEPFDERGATVVVAGDLDLETAPQLESAIAGTVSGGHHHLVIDLSAATFLDSMAMGTLLRSLAPLQNDPAAAVVLVRGPAMIQRVLQVSGIGQMFTQFQTRAAAIEGVTGTEPLGALWRRVRDRS